MILQSLVTLHSRDQTMVTYGCERHAFHWAVVLDGSGRVVTVFDAWGNALGNLNLGASYAGATFTVSGGVLSVLRRGKSRSAEPDGCDPAVFAEQIASYLERLAQERPITQVMARMAWAGSNSQSLTRRS